MPHFFLHPLAENDIGVIADFIGLELKSPKAACRFIDEIEEKFELHAQFPEMGELRPELGPHVRCFPFRNKYVIVYRPVPKGIDVLRVLHGRDYSLLFPEG